MATSCNEGKCICPDKNCERHGKCCLCITYHIDDGSLVSCMKQIANKR